MSTRSRIQQAGTGQETPPMASGARRRKRTAAEPTGVPADPWQTIADLQHLLDARVAERDEAMAREAAMAEVLGVMVDSEVGAFTEFTVRLPRHPRTTSAATPA